MASGVLGFNRVEKRRDGRRATQSQKHQTEVICKNKMRYGKQNTGKTAAAKIWQHGFNAFAKWERRVFHIPALRKAAGKQHERHQSDAVSRGPEMHFNELSITPFAANQSRHDVVHRTENRHREKRIEAKMRVGDAHLSEI